MNQVANQVTNFDLIRTEQELLWDLPSQVVIYGRYKQRATKEMKGGQEGECTAEVGVHDEVEAALFLHAHVAAHHSALIHTAFYTLHIIHEMT